MNLALLEKNAQPATALAVSRRNEPAIIDADFVEVNSKKGWLARKTQRFSLWRDKRALEGDLRILAKAVYGHEAAGLPRGHDIYQKLNTAIEVRVRDFCTKYEVPREPVEAQIPVISKARELACPPKPLAKAKKGLGLWILACIALLGLGFATGLFAVGYHACLRLFHLA